MRVSALALLLLIALSGCSGKSPSNDDPADDGNDPADPGSEDPGTGDGTDAVLPDVEVLNTEIDFAAPGGSGGGSEDFTLPLGYGNFTVDIAIVGDCPGGLMSDPVVALIDPDGEDVGTVTVGTLAD